MSPAMSAPGGAAPVPASGTQWTIVHGDFAATITEVGGGLRTFAIGGRELVAGYAVDEPCPHVRGAQLMPWPNRIRDGRWSDDGVPQQLPIDEIEYRNASHGLVRWALWEPVAIDSDSVTIAYRLHPQPGWRHHLLLRTTYALDPTGLIVTTAARNVGSRTAPFGYGGHPYLAIGATPAAEVRLRVPAETWLDVDERMLPRETHPVEGTRFDFRAARALGAEVVDHAFTGFERDAAGRWSIDVESDAAGLVTLWADEAFGWAQVFTGAAHLGLGMPGIAVEPLTCPAEAFNSGVGLIRLAPGQEWTGTWGITAG